jgi:ADP-heptose:LPS heptosyltransferase
LARTTVEVLRAAGAVVALTGTAAETSPLRSLVDDRVVFDLGGATPWRDLAALVAASSAVVCGNTGIGHLAAALATPVVSVFAPTVDPQQWQPWGESVVVLGDHAIACAGCRARSCPWGEPICVNGVEPDDVLRALDHLGVALAERSPRAMAATT